MAVYNQSLVFNGLGTFSTIVPIAGPYVVAGNISLPILSQGGAASSVVVVVNQNGSPVYTGLAGAEGFKTDVTCAANDTIAVVLSSGAAADNALNAVKTTMQIFQGV